MVLIWPIFYTFHNYVLLCRHYIWVTHYTQLWWHNGLVPTYRSGSRSCQLAHTSLQNTTLSLVSSIPLVPPPPDSTAPLRSTTPTVPPSLVQNTHAIIVCITLQPMMSIIRFYITQAVPANNLPLANKLNHYLNGHDPPCYCPMQWGHHWLACIPLYDYYKILLAFIILCNVAHLFRFCFDPLVDYPYT